MADRFRGVVRGGPGSEELAERTHVREQAPQTARVQRAADRKRDANLATSGHSGPQSGPRDRYDRASLIAKIHAAPVIAAAPRSSWQPAYFPIAAARASGSATLTHKREWSRNPMTLGSLSTNVIHNPL